MRGRGSGFVLLGKGPALDSDCDDDRFVYNGSDRGGGRVFQWYRKAVFQDRLREQGWTKRGCRTGASVHASVTEQQCMAALKLTHEHLARFPASCAMLDSFAGLQCYPQLADDAKYQANEVSIAEAAGEAVPELAMAREQMRCWLQCDGCARWRLVDRRSFSAVDPAAFAKPKRGTEDGRDWAAWFAGAPQRYAACRDGHALRLAAQGRGGDALDVEQAAVQPAGPVVALHEADSNVAGTVVQSDDECAASEAPKSGCDTSECGSAEEGAGGAAAAELRVALRGLGGRGGGLRSCEAAELERLSRREASRDVRAGARVDVGMQDVDVEGAGGDVAGKQAAFRCEMRMTKERPDPESDAV